MKKLAMVLMAILAVSGAYAQDSEQQEKKLSKVGFQMTVDLEGSAAFSNGFKLNDFVNMDSYTAGGVGATLGVGARIGKAFYVGAALGAQGEWGKAEWKQTTTEGTTIKDLENMATNTSAWIVPLYADLRLYIPTKKNCFPFIEAGVGGYYGMNNVKELVSGETKDLSSKGLYFIGGAGLEFRRWNFGLGYRLLRDEGINNNHFYAKVGVNFGRPVKLRKITIQQ